MKVRCLDYVEYAESLVNHDLKHQNTGKVEEGEINVPPVYWISYEWKIVPSFYKVDGKSYSL